MKILFWNRGSTSSRIYRLLSEANYDLYVCNKMEHANEVIEREKIQLVFCRVIDQKDLEQIDLVPKMICLIAILDDKKLADECIKYGADDYIIDSDKLTKEELLRVINKNQIASGFRAIKEKIKMLEYVTTNGK